MKILLAKILQRVRGNTCMDVDWNRYKMGQLSEFIPKNCLASMFRIPKRYSTYVASVIAIPHWYNRYVASMFAIPKKHNTCLASVFVIPQQFSLAGMFVFKGGILYAYYRTEEFWILIGLKDFLKIA